MAVIKKPDPNYAARIHAWFTAVVSNDLHLMDDLLAHGVPVDVPHPLRHTTALMEATRRGRSATVHWLLEHGATPDLLCGIPQSTPIHHALRRRYLEIAQMLVGTGKPVHHLDELGRTPLHVLVGDVLASDDMETLIAIARQLVACQCPLDALDREGITALHYAVLSDHEELVATLLELGANPNVAAPDTASTPLAMAALEKNANIAALLMQYGANPHHELRDGVTPATIFPAITRMVAGVSPLRTTSPLQGDAPLHPRRNLH